MNGTPWTDQEIATLERLVAEGTPLKAIEAALPGRGKYGVRKAMARRGLSIRQARGGAIDWPAACLAAYKRHGGKLTPPARELKISLTTLRAHLAAAGVPAKKIAEKRARRISRARVEDLAAQGWTRREIASALGMTYKGVCNAVLRWGADVRHAPTSVAMPGLDELRDALAQWGVEGVAEEWSVSEATARGWLAKLAAIHEREGMDAPHVKLAPPAVAEEVAATLRELVAQGLDREQIAQAMGASYGTTAERLRRLGLKPRRKAYTRAAPEPIAQEGPRDWEELSDAIATWGVDGAAEEYEVTPGQIMRWRMELCGEAI